MPYKNKEVQREFQRLRIAARRATWFQDKSCVDCGIKENLELHHINPITKISHRIFSWSWNRIQEETSKCVVCCVSCHKLRTAMQVHKPLVHGTYSGYMHHGCRCNLCVKEASNVRERNRKVRGRKHQKSYKPK
jgi:hypothetical protein